MANEAILSVPGGQYNALEDIAIQIVGADTQEFRLRVSYPRAPFDALAIVSGRLVHANDEITYLASRSHAIAITTFNHETNWIQIKGLNELSTPDSVKLLRRTTSSWSSMGASGWEGTKFTQIKTDGNIKWPVGSKVQFITPKGSFIISIVED